MRLAGRIDIAAPQEAVWAALVDPIRLSACVPGARDARQVDARTFEGTISAAIGPMTGEFAFAAVLAATAFPDDLRVEVAGTDSVTNSRVTAAVRASVAAIGPSATALTYDATVTVGGRLAIVGEMILRATAGAMVAEATRCLRARLEAGSSLAAATERRS